jgi:uncharacterized SAM-binding protein YcdF (DUF218 family)
MYELAAKSFWLISQPSNMMALTLFAGVVLLALRRPSGPAFLVLGAFMAAIGGLLPVGEWLLNPLENRFPSLAAKLPAHVDGIVILGGGETPHLTFKRGQVTLNDNSERLIAGAMLAIHYPKARIIHTGGGGNPAEMLESGVARAFFGGLGLKGGRFIYEDRSLNTFENATTTLKLAKPQPGETWLLVTSAFHMPRAVGVFRQAGWRVTPYPVGYYSDTEKFALNKPNVAKNLEKLDLAVHEWIGLAAYKLLEKSPEYFPGR